MSFLSGGFAAGGGAEALEDLLKRLFVEGQERTRAKEAQQRIGLDEKRLQLDTDYKNAMLDDRNEARMAATQAGAASRADRLADDLTPGMELDTATEGALKAGDRGNLVKGPTLGSTNIGGDLLKGRLVMTPNPGKGPTFTGTAGQLRVKADAERAAADREQTRQDRIAAQAQARQDRIDAREDTQANQRSMAQLVASLKPQGTSADPSAALAKEQNDVEDSLALIEQIRQDRALPKATGPFDARGIGMVRDLEGVTRVKALHDNLVNRMQLAQAGKLKGQGQISNMEREMLAKAATALTLKLGDADYLSELAKVEAQFRRMLSGPRATAAPTTPGSGFRVVEIK